MNILKDLMEVLRLSIIIGFALLVNLYASEINHTRLNLDETVLTVSTVSLDGKSGGSISYDLGN